MPTCSDTGATPASCASDRSATRCPRTTSPRRSGCPSRTEARNRERRSHTAMSQPANVYLPHLELLERSEIEALQLRKLRVQVARLYETNPFWRKTWQAA